MKTKLLLLFTLFSLVLQAQVSQTERQALIDFYNATDGDNWTNNTNWDTDINSTSDVSDWFGISTEIIVGQKYIRAISLSDNNLVGTLPDFKDLTKLLRLEIADNTISGEIDIAKLPTTLQVLQLSINQLTGGFPNLASLNDLLVVQLYNNKLTGVISKGNFPTTIKSISIGLNQISGELDVSTFTNIETVIVHDTAISFLKIPNSVTGLSVRYTPNLAFIEVPNVNFFYKFK
jgi:hypothetical protein